MLRLLAIRNFAVIDALEVEFDGGFTVLTGETGAGKSILTDAILLVGGGRAQADVIRSDAETATVEAVFELSRRNSARAVLESEPIQRFHRDVHGAAHHAALGWDAVAEQFGRHALGPHAL